MMRARRLVCVILTAIVISAFSVPMTALANGGTLRLAKVPAGPHLLSVWTQPDPPRAGRLDIGVAVMRPPEATAILDADVQIRAERIDGIAGAATSPATRGAGGNLLLYHAALELPAAGRWRVTVLAQSPLGNGHAAFDLAVEGPSPLPWILGVLAVATAVGWLLWRLKPRRGRAVAGLGGLVVALPSVARGRHPDEWQEQGFGVLIFAVSFIVTWAAGALLRWRRRRR